MDFYSLLGVPRSASASEIKAAFRKKAVEHHPDKHVDAAEHEKHARSQRFKAISEAYETLSNDAKRRTYDLSHRYGAGSSSPHGRSQQSYQQHPYYTGREYAYSGRGSQQQQQYTQQGFWSAFKIFSKGMTAGDAYFHLLLAGCVVGGTLLAQGVGDSLWQSHNSGKMFEDIQRRKAVKPPPPPPSASTPGPELDHEAALAPVPVPVPTAASEAPAPTLNAGELSSPAPAPAHLSASTLPQPDGDSGTDQPAPPSVPNGIAPVSAVPPQAADVSGGLNQFERGDEHGAPSVLNMPAVPCGARPLPFRTHTAPRRSPVAASRGRQLLVTAAASAYICKDCGWIYEEKSGKAFKDLPSSFKCPVCAAPKRRFGTYSGPKGSNTKAAMDERYEKLQSGGGSGASGSTIAAVTGVGLVGLGCLYLFLQSQY